MRSLPRLRRLAPASVGRKSKRPLISVVIPAYNVAPYIRQTLRSVLTQNVRDLDVIVVDDGSTDATVRIVRRTALLDRRVRLIRGAHGGPGVARNLGVDAARGKYLCFVDADDVLPPGSLDALLRPAERSGADLVLGALRRFNSTRRWTAEWVGEVHTAARSGVTLDDFPPMLRNFYPVGKLYRRDFWTAQGLRFGDEYLFEDQPLVTQMLNRAKSIEVITEIVYDYRAREDRSSNSQRPEELRNVVARVAAWDRSIAALQQEASAAVQRAWLLTVYATHLHWYLNNDAVADPEYWAILRDAMRRLAQVAPPDLLEETPVARRAAVALLLADRHADLLAFRAAGGYERGGLPATPRPDGLEHSLPLPQAAVDVITASCSLHTPAERVELRQHAVGGGWVETDGLHFRFLGYAYVPDLAHRRPDAITLRLVDEHGAGTPVAARLLGELAVDDPADAGQGYVADIPTAAFRGASESWTVEVEVTYGPLSVRGALHNLARRGGLTEAGLRALPDGRCVRLGTSPNRHVPAVFSVVRPALTATTVSLDADGTLRVQGVLAEATARPSRLTATLGRTSASAAITGTGRTFAAELQLPASPPRGHHDVSDWVVRARGAGSAETPVAWPAGREQALTRVGDLIAMATVAGNVKVEDHRASGVCTVAAVESGGSSLRLACTVAGPDHTPAAVTCELPPAEQWPHGTEAQPISYDARTQRLTVGAGGVPVLADPGALTDLPLCVPGTALVLERGTGRSLTLRMPAQR